MIRKIYNTIVKSTLYTKYRLFRECMHYFFLLQAHNASTKTDKVKNKMEYTLLRENHVIEKGMSMKNPRQGFGQEKVTNLLKRLDVYYTTYCDVEFLQYPLSTILEYIKYTKINGSDIPKIEELLNMLLAKCSINPETLKKSAGIKSVSKEAILNSCSTDFNQLLYNRHSIRYFTNNIPNKELINQALIMAQRTPSACNRQAWKTHIYFGKKSNELLKKQGGCNGFEDEIHCSIIVTADMNGFLSYEPFQQYVDGGLYAMNLINALQAVGLGTIPLSCGFLHKKLDGIIEFGEIPNNETPIVIIGVGELLDNFNVAVSTRKPVTQTTIFHN